LDGIHPIIFDVCVIVPLTPTFDSAVISFLLQFGISAAASLSGTKVPDSAYFSLYHSDVRRIAPKAPGLGFWMMLWVITSRM
jgi:hypothetical protein